MRHRGEERVLHLVHLAQLGHRGALLLVGHAQLALGPRALGDVDGGDQTRRDALELDLARDDLDVEDRPVLLAVPPRPVGVAPVDRHDELLDVLVGADVRQ